MGNTIRTTGTEVPDDFPAEVYDRLNERAAEIDHTDYQWSHFGPAWNGVAYRFLGAARADERLRESMVRDGPTPRQPMRTEQELDLFTFVTCANSATESFAYATFALGALIRPGSFPMQEKGHLQAISLKSTAEAYDRAFPKDPFVHDLLDLIDGPVRKRVEQWRNVLIHRASPGRTIHAVVGVSEPPPATRWKLWVHHLADVELGPEMTAEVRSWLADSIKDNIDQLHLFLDRKVGSAP